MRIRYVYAVHLRSEGNRITVGRWLASAASSKLGDGHLFYGKGGARVIAGLKFMSLGSLEAVNNRVGARRDLKALMKFIVKWPELLSMLPLPGTPSIVTDTVSIHRVDWLRVRI